MAKKLKVVKNRGTLYLMTEDNEGLGIQMDMRVLSPSCGNKNHVIVSVDFRVPLEDFCTETIDEDKGELVATIKGSDIALAFDRYKRMDKGDAIKEIEKDICSSDNFICDHNNEVKENRISDGSYLVKHGLKGY